MQKKKKSPFHLNAPTNAGALTLAEHIVSNKPETLSRRPRTGQPGLLRLFAALLLSSLRDSPVQRWCRD